MSGNPFSVNKFEYGAKNLYFLLPGVFEKLEAMKPIYLIGSRGTGKTTLLKAMSWRERLNNENLRRVVSGPVAENYIGVYLKTPSIQTRTIDGWLGEFDERFYAPIFSYYFDLVWLQEALEGVWSLSREHYLTLGVQEEIDIVDEVLDRFGSKRTGLGFRGMLSEIRDRRVAIERYALLFRDPVEVVEELALSEQLSRFGIDVAKIVLGKLKDASEIGFKVCIDESEEFTARQQIVINSIVRNAEHPLLLVLSYVREPDDPHTTLFSSLKLQADDRRILPLDEALGTDQGFARLCEGITTTRLAFLRDGLSEDPAPTAFGLKRFLGTFGTNTSLKRLLERSVNPNARELLNRSVEMADHAFFDSSKEDLEPPIYQTYLIDRLGVNIGDEKTPWKRRRQDSAELRKRQVAAYLSIAFELDLSLEYYGSEVLLQLCDNCVRDYLNQMNCVVEDAQIDADDIPSETAARDVQVTAIARASKEKHDRIQEAELSILSETERLVDGLGRIAARLQRESSDGRHLRSSERGIFTWSFTSSSQDSRLYRMLTEACETGYLKLTELDEGEIKFRVHTSMAAHYGFSYRGAYYPVELHGYELQRLASAETENGLEKAVLVVVNRMNGEESSEQQTMSLFDDEP